MSKNFSILITLARRVIVPLVGAAMSLGWISGAHSQQSAPVPVEAVGIPSIITDAEIRGVVLFQGNSWRVVREFPGGYIDVFQKGAQGIGWIPVDLKLDWRRRIHPMQIGEGRSGELLIASYDVVDNLPSGRSQGVVTNGIDVWRLDRRPSGMPEPERMHANLQIGGVDSLLYADFKGLPAKLCGENQCYSWTSAHDLKKWKLEGLANYEFVELIFSGEQAAALLRQRHDDRQSGPLDANYSSYKLSKLKIDGADISSIPDEGIPWGLYWKDGQATYHMATAKEQYRKLFLYDLARMPFSGGMSFGSNNLEGRIAWAQVYYLNGMMSVVGGAAKALFDAPPAGLRERVLQEVQLIADLCENSYPGYLVKRYSLDREPLESVLHLSRIASVLVRAKETSGFQLKQSCMSSLKRRLAAFDGTLEDPMKIELGKQKLPYLRLRKGIPFWADGMNVPYNYVSAYAEGVLALGADEGTKKQLGKMLEVVRQLERLDGPQYPRTWRYCGGICDEGWKREDAISVNAPSWAGNGKALAHVSYRTMDARAILELARARPGSVDRRLVKHFHELTSTGWLLPSMNEVFSKSGPIALISPDVARRYARSSAPWEIQSAVWALNQLALDAVK